MTSYADTVTLLQQLKLLGFTDTAYRVLHDTALHDTAKDTIETHLAFAAEHTNMKADSRSECIQQRLRLICDAYMKAGFRSGREDVFVALATAARAEIPS